MYIDLGTKSFFSTNESLSDESDLHSGNLTTYSPSRLPLPGGQALGWEE